MRSTPSVVLPFALALSPLAAPRAQCSPGPALTNLQHVTDATNEVFDVVTGDVDADGDQDVVYLSGRNLWIRRNDQPNGLGPTLVVAGIAPVDHFVMEDVDHDTLPDFVVVTTVSVPVGAALHREARLQVWRNVTPAGGWFAFSLLQDALLVPAGPSVGAPGIVAADLDADGITDVVLDSRSTGWIFRGEGAHGVPTGRFLAPILFDTGIVSGGAMTIADFDVDGTLDLAMLSVALVPGKLRIFAGQHDAAGRPLGTFGATYDTTVTAGAHRVLRVRDLDMDGVPDLVFGRSGEVHVARGLGGFAFASPIVYAQFYAESPFLGDFDRDGRTDIGVPLSANALALPNFAVMRDPLGVNGWVMLWLDTGYPLLGTTADLDGDDKVDIAVGKLTGKMTTALGGCSTFGVPGIHVTVPNGGEQWAAGTSQQIAWTTSAPCAAFDIDVSFDAGSSWERIANGVTGSSFWWWVTEPATTAALVRVKPTDLENFADTSDAPFTISGAGLAAVAEVGGGCGVPRAPRGGATVPRLGTVGALDVTLATAGQLTAWWVSVPIAPPLSLGAPGCDVHMDPAALTLVATTVTDANGHAAVPLTIPFAPVLTGFVVAAQATVFVASSPLGMQVTNGVLLTLGQ